MAFRRKRLYDGTIIYHPVVEYDEDNRIDLENNTLIQALPDTNVGYSMRNTYNPAEIAKRWFNKIINLVKNT
jgi:hypothetical protein